ncbi:uncharacterized protein LOC126987581 isoform X2 [Eriocheir sinensis]|uniref:uncharacterized protein LOC126987581 isoform X2 n=1 Tax=Eriocheir sinensis TaxID=95602 RepID=UPI0021C813F6|nr:uncharacterized protein LOC126987581 isoform X2 [Eriocheir sinensis]
MPRVSAKRKALSELNRQKVMKRRRKKVTEAEPTPTGHAAAPPLHPPLHTHTSTASFRHSLLPEEEQEIKEACDDSALVNISVQRLSALLELARCNECGNKCVSKITTKCFDCTVSLRCEECEVTVHHSEPKKCKNSGYGEGNGHPVKVMKLPQPASPPRDIKVVEVKEEPTCTEEDAAVLPLQEHDPLAIKPEPVPWQPSGSQEEPQPQESDAVYLKEEIVAESHAFYLKEEIDIKEEDILSFNTEELAECVTDRGESLFQGPQEDTEELPLKRRKVVQAEA